MRRVKRDIRASRVAGRRRPTYAEVMSTLALFLALVGGTALAAGLPKNSVGSRTVKDGSLRSVDLADGSGVSGADVVDGSLGGADVADGSLGGAALLDGSLGAAELAGGSVSGFDIAAGAVDGSKLKPNAVTSAAVLDKNLRGSDFSLGTLTGEDIDESTLGQVPEVAALAGVGTPHGLVSTVIYERETPLSFGAEVDPNTFELSLACDVPEDLLLAGGANSTGPTATVLESVPIPVSSQLRAAGAWRARVSGGAGLWSLHIVCARQRQP
jgi:hypothetical protein